MQLNTNAIIVIVNSSMKQFLWLFCTTVYYEQRSNPSVKI